MSNIRYLTGQLDLFWRNYQRDFAGFDKPQIVPAATLRGAAPLYFRRYIDQDPQSWYMIVAGDPLRHEDISRDKACELFDKFFYDHMHMPSSYDVNAGGQYSRQQAVDKEVLPARNDSEYRTFYDEQMDALRQMDAEAASEDAGAEDTGAEDDAQDDNVFNVEMGSDGVYRVASDRNASERGVQASSGTAVGMLRKIWYGCDFHIPSGGGMLGMGSAGDLGGCRRHGRLGRGSAGFLREGEEKDLEPGKPGKQGEPDEVSQPDLLERIFDALKGIEEAIKGLRGSVSEDDKAALLDECENIKAECEKCGDPSCKNGEKCGNKIGENVNDKDIIRARGIDNCIAALDKVKVANEGLARKKNFKCQSSLNEDDLDEFEPEEDGSEYYGKVMREAAMIPDEELSEDDGVLEDDLNEMLRIGRSIR